MRNARLGRLPPANQARMLRLLLRARSGCGAWPRAPRVRAHASGLRALARGADLPALDQRAAAAHRRGRRSSRAAWSVARHLVLLLSPSTPTSATSRCSRSPTATSSTPASSGINCLYCHATVDRAPVAVVPPTQVCMNCHRVVKRDSPALAPIRDERDERPADAAGCGCTTCPTTPTSTTGRTCAPASAARPATAGSTRWRW